MPVSLDSKIRRGSLSRGQRAGTVARVRAAQAIIFRQREQVVAHYGNANAPLPADSRCLRHAAAIRARTRSRRARSIHPIPPHRVRIPGQP